ncbi:MAG: class I SAM-dependent methyltransferase [Thermomicrobiales bacterium]
MQGWTEAASQHFIDLGRIYTPRRDEIARAFVDLIPANEDEAFLGAELGTGQGWLTTAILRNYPHAKMIGLDGSEVMLAATKETVGSYGDRFEGRLFRLEESDWIESLPDGLRGIVSSLVIHHLEGPGKRALFRALFAKLGPGGGLLINDVMEPASAWGRRHWARAWNADVERQSHELGGDGSAFDAFVADKWNVYEYPTPEDDIDHPSTVVEQLTWLAEAGFTSIDVWWARAGHVLFGGYK